MIARRAAAGAAVVAVACLAFTQVPEGAQPRERDLVPRSRDLVPRIRDVAPQVVDISRPTDQGVTLDADVLFAFDSAELSDAATRLLDDVVDLLAEEGATDVLVHGHTDDIGDEAYNLDLSRRRAAAVRDALLERAPDLSITSEGFGESEPVVPNDSAANRALNRRVEIRRAD